MSIGQEYLREFDEEMASSRKVLERVPTEKGQWKPHREVVLHGTPRAIGVLDAGMDLGFAP